ncbi:MAG: tetratricopeptide repeat protein [Thermoanaerobaculia bacterium]|nr:tetratricopeptide repeat protein [Thermoanaerobaculia bacterium]
MPQDYLTRNLVGQLHYMLGVTFERQDLARSLRELAEAAQAAPDNDVLFFNLGLIYGRMGRAEDAERAFARAAAIDPRARQGEGNLSVELQSVTID